MALIQYIGPHRDGAYVPFGFGGIEALPGQTIEVPDDLAASLLEQKTNWRRVRKPARKKESTA